MPRRRTVPTDTMRARQTAVVLSGRQAQRLASGQIETSADEIDGLSPEQARKRQCRHLVEDRRIARELGLL